jgi:hypothetical protein
MVELLNRHGVPDGFPFVIGGSDGEDLFCQRQ